jgi:hypothetical protein
MTKVYGRQIWSPLAAPYVPQLAANSVYTNHAVVASRLTT